MVINFTDQSSGNPTQWRWDLGNGTSSALQNPSATYLQPGLYTIKLCIQSANGLTDSVTRVNYIRIFGSPAVDFFTSDSIGCNGLTSRFTDRTITNGDNIISRQWDFGDGQLSTEVNPSHYYLDAGTFNVTLKINTANGCVASLRKSSCVTNYKIRAAFTTRTAATCNTNKIVFKNLSDSGMGIRYEWYFGDGTYSSDRHPVHTYSGNTVYTVKLITINAGGCRDSVSAPVTILQPVSAAFTVDRNVSCTYPAPFQFSAPPVPGNSYRWIMGDGFETAEQNPSHVFSASGMYSVKLVVRNINGCADSVTRDNYITVQRIKTTLVSLPDSGCAPFTKTFKANLESYDSVIRYTWKIGSDIILNGNESSYTFQNTGNYDVTLITTTVNGCIDSVKKPAAILLGAKPAAAFSVNLANVCANTPVSFTDLSTGSVTSWSWDFGDFSGSNDKNPLHIYLDSGWMNVTLIAANHGCADTATRANVIFLKPSVARFRFAFDCAVPFRRTFTNQSRGAQRLLWDFGDGTQSTEFEPVHIFPATGTYDVSLKTWNDTTGCEYTLIKPVKITNISADFTVSKNTVCKGDSIFFQAVPNPDIVRCQWTFGDGNNYNSFGNSAGHKYQQNGLFTVQLLVKDGLGCSRSISKNNLVTVKGPVAKFGIASREICPGSQVQFSDSTPFTATPTAWVWNYGDGAKDSLLSPPFIHTYTATGNFRPSLKVIDADGCTDTCQAPNPIHSERIIPAFTQSDTVVCTGKPVRFICAYSVPGVSYRWDFGDSGNAFNQAPEHVYLREGVYTVKLVINKANNCSDSMIKTAAVKVRNTSAGFTMSDSFSTCPPLMVHFTSTSGNAAEEFWNFGDSTGTAMTNPSHYYTYPGNYTVTLRARGNSGCTSSVQKHIVIGGPKATIASDKKFSCFPYAYNFVTHTEEAVSHVWDFGDGVVQTGVDTVINHTYTGAGNFRPKIIVQDTFGCRVPVELKDTLLNIFITPQFVVTDTAVCLGTAVHFSNSSLANDSIISYTMHFGDSTSAASVNTAHNYPRSGIYTPWLQARSLKGCVATYISAVPITISGKPAIILQPVTGGCAPLPVSFSAYGTGADSSSLQWKWILGNNDTVMMQHPPAKLFSNPGNYMISATATNLTGCSSTRQDTIEIYALPDTKISGDSFVCRGSIARLSATGASRFRWQAQAPVDCDTCLQINSSPLQDTRYKVYGTSLQGCTSTDSVSVRVYQPLQLQYRPASKICKGSSTTLQVSGAEQYRWSPSNGLSSAAIANPVASPDTTITYTVIGTGEKGCFKDTASVRVMVYDHPVVKACEDKTVVAGNSVILTATYSADVTEAFWNPVESMARYDPSMIEVKPKENTEYTIKVSNAGGCSAEDRVNVFVTCNNNNVFVPTLFSPNNDGANDIFYPRGTGIFKIQSFRIFNRWGEVVFEKRAFNANDPSAGWNGTFRGSKLTADVYVYVMELVCDNSSVLSLKGNVTLVL